MSIFGNIMSKIFHHGEASAAPASQTGGNSPVPTPGAAAGSSAPVAANDVSASPAGTGAASAAPQNVDVAAVLDGLAAKNAQTLDWKRSIVDMMKLLGLDSSLTARQELAKELNYSGDMQDSASMNIWLHKQVMQKLAANGGKVPDDLKA